MSSMLGFSNENYERENIYLWDVSLSMWGQNGERDIQKDVQEKLESAIGKLDQSTKILVVPFQNKILDAWNSSKISQKKIQKNVSGIKNSKLRLTNTNVDKAIELAIENINSKIPSRVYLLSDGLHNDSNVENLKETIDTWDKMARENKAIILFYTTDLSSVPSYYKNKANIKFVDNLDVDIRAVQLGEVSDLSTDQNLVINLIGAQGLHTSTSCILKTADGKEQKVDLKIQDSKLTIDKQYLSGIGTVDVNVSMKDFESGVEYVLNSNLKFPRKEVVQTASFNWSWLWWLLLLLLIPLLIYSPQVLSLFGNLLSIPTLSKSIRTKMSKLSIDPIREISNIRKYKKLSSGVQNGLQYENIEMEGGKSGKIVDFGPVSIANGTIPEKMYNLPDKEQFVEAKRNMVKDQYSTSTQKNKMHMKLLKGNEEVEQNDNKILDEIVSSKIARLNEVVTNKNLDISKRKEALSQLRKLTHSVTFKTVTLEDGFTKLDAFQALERQKKDLNNSNSGLIYGYIGHHDIRPGNIQFVRMYDHYKNPHIGGREFWGGGAQNR